MGLKEYNDKRRFNETPEPAGRKLHQARQLRFVVQRHDASHLHYDFRLEMEGVLKSWAVPKGPSLNPKDRRLAMHVEDHPYEYKDFAGLIPAGNYGAGQVEIWDEGTISAYEKEEGQTDEEALLAGLAAGELKFVMHGHKLQGAFGLVRMKGKKGSEWLLFKKKDEYAVQEAYDAEDEPPLKQHGHLKVWKSGKAVKANADETAEAAALEAEKTPAKKGSKSTSAKAASTAKAAEKKPAKRVIGQEEARSIDDLPASKIPHDLKPMLAELGKDLFEDAGWIYELKWDGYRCLARIEYNKGKTKVELASRNQKDFTTRYAEVTQELAGLKRNCLIDGEIVVLDKQGRPSFNAIQQYGQNHAGLLVFYAFDLIYLDNKDLSHLPLLQRKQLLADLLKDLLPKAQHIRYSEHVEGEAKKLFEHARKHGLEGVMAKQGQSHYTAGRRSRNWIKLKHQASQDAVIIGFTPPKGGRKQFGSLLLAVKEGRGYRYIGNVGTGFNQQLLASIMQQMEPLITKEKPVEGDTGYDRVATWVKPKLVCEVTMTEYTNDGIVRHPVFKGMREDKKPTETRPETPVDEGQTYQITKGGSRKKELIIKTPEGPVTITNSTKVLWPDEGYTKADLAEYYHSVSKYILPYLKDRPQSLHRHPNGIHDKGFFQKDWGDDALPDFVESQDIYSESNRKEIKYLLCQNQATLLYLANLGCIELNPWNSTVQDLHKPTWIVIDLDPADNPFHQVVEAAQATKEVLDRAGVKGYPKTSGSTGIHIYIPLGGRYDYEQAGQFAHLIATLVNDLLPGTTSTVRSVKARGNMIYLDYLQNRMGQTLAAPYCLRPRPEATASAPLEWSEVKKGLSPHDFTIKNMLQRIERKGDLFAPVLGKGIDIAKALKKLE